MKVRPYKRGNRTGWEVDISVTLPNGKRLRERKRAPVSSKSAARRWGEERERLLFSNRGRKPKKEVPTIEAFLERFIDGHCRANKHKPSGIHSRERAFHNYIIPRLGKRKLDRVTAEDIAQLKGAMQDYKPATVNNTLSALNVMLKCAAEWGVIDEHPVRIKLLKAQKARRRFYDFDEYQWLIDASIKVDKRVLAIVLLGGDAGLRRGEIIGLEQSDIDFRRHQLTVRRSVWKGHETDTKGLAERVVPMTKRLEAALRDIRHLRGERLLYTDAGLHITAKVVKNWMARAQRRAQLKPSGEVHILRHTFCSHLAMRGATPIQIQRLAGHKDLQTTMGYMHLAEGETRRAIDLLEGEQPIFEAANASQNGEILETQAGPKTNLSVIQ